MNFNSCCLLYCALTADSKLELERLSMDGRSVWFLLRQCEGMYSTSSHCLITPRMLYKALSHDQHNNFESANDSYQSNSASNSSIPRSRSAECNLLLQPEPIGTAGLSAPASLAPSRRGSAHVSDEDNGLLKTEMGNNWGMLNLPYF